MAFPISSVSWELGCRLAVDNGREFNDPKWWWLMLKLFFCSLTAGKMMVKGVVSSDIPDEHYYSFLILFFVPISESSRKSLAICCHHYFFTLLSISPRHLHTTVDIDLWPDLLPSPAFIHRLLSPPSGGFESRLCDPPQFFTGSLDFLLGWNTS